MSVSNEKPQAKRHQPDGEQQPGASGAAGRDPAPAEAPTAPAPKRRGRPPKAPHDKAPLHKPERVKRPHRIHDMRRTPTGQIIRKDATPEEVEAIMKKSAEAVKKPRGATMFKRWRVDEILRPEHRDEYERLMQTPGVTGDRLHDWLTGRGYDVCVRAVRMHRKAFCNQVRDVKTAARAAQAFAAVARKEGPSVMAEAAALRFEQLLMENLFDLKDGVQDLTKNFDPSDWVHLGKATGLLLNARGQVEKLREESHRRARDRDAEHAKLEAEEQRKNETPEQRKARGTKVAERVCEMLGMPVWQGDEDWRYGVPKFQCETFIALDGTRRDINGRIVADSEVDEQGYLKTPPPPDYVPPGIEPLVPPVPHPRATKQFAAVEPVDRPLAQAIYEAKHAAAQKAAAEGKAYKPPKGGYRYVPVGEPHGPPLPPGPEQERRDEQMLKEHAAREQAAKEKREKE